MSNGVEENNKLNIDFALELMGRKLDMQMHAHNSLESKVGVLLGFVGVIAGSSIVLLQNKTELVGINIFTLGLVGIYLTLILLVFASRTRTFLDPPDFPAFYSEGALAKQNIELKNQAIADMKSAYQTNNKNHQRKCMFFDHAIYCFALSVLLLFLGIFGR